MIYPYIIKIDFIFPHYPNKDIVKCIFYRKLIILHYIKSIKYEYNVVGSDKDAFRVKLFKFDVPRYIPSL